MMEDVNASPDCDLGRKDYWENFYSKELENFEAYGDEGDIWFGKKNVERIVNWIINNNIDKSSPILDVGCGNGATLVSLGKKGFKDLTGVDYAKEAIQLAENVAKTHNINAKFQVLDFLNDDEVSEKYHVIIDKGTYDAISLCPDNVKNKQFKYREKVNQLLSTTGYFILFSCNWTKEEIELQFKGFKIYEEIEIPSIAFGGKTGQTVTAVVLTKTVNTG